MPKMAYSHGLHALGNSCYAWLQPNGGWGWSNSGLITGAGCSLMVDTLFDLATTADMLAGVASVTDQFPIGWVVNTHSDGDHYFGNELLLERGVEIIATAAAAELMTQDAVEEVAALKRAGGAVGEFARTVFAPFTFDGITSTGPSRTFSQSLSIDVGGREVCLIEVGPAHTSGDALVYVPDAQVVYTGDILFIGGTPIVWAGPPKRWIAACDLLLDLDVTTIVPGHGPLTDKAGVHQVRNYLAFIVEEGTKRFEDGLDLWAATASIDLGPYAQLTEKGRLVQNIASVYRALDPGAPPAPRIQVLEHMATLEGFEGSQEMR